jgi:hypothetical protein
MVIHLRSVHVKVVARVNAKRTWDVPSYFVSPGQSHVILSFSYLLPHIATICSYLFWYTTLRDEVAMLTPLLLSFHTDSAVAVAIGQLFGSFRVANTAEAVTGEMSCIIHAKIRWRCSHERKILNVKVHGNSRVNYAHGVGNMVIWIYLGVPRIWVPPNHLELNHFRYVSIEIHGFRVPPFWKTSISS